MQYLRSKPGNIDGQSVGCCDASVVNICCSNPGARVVYDGKRFPRYHLVFRL